MTYSTLFAASAAALLLATTAHAGPGEDPVVLTNKVNYLQLPTAAATKSTDIVYKRGLPDDTNAKVARYSAQAFRPNQTGVSTEKDVVQAVKTNGTQTTCYQSVGSVSGSTAGGTVFMNNEQVVVLRGDLINICN